MKIFNWVQKRLNPNIFRESGFGRSSVKKGDPCVGSELDSVLESWKDGILTIGTFGYDPLKHFSQHDHHHQLFPQDSWSQEEDDQHNDDDEEYHTCINNNNNAEAAAAAGKLEEEDEELNPLIWKPATADDVQSYYSADTTDDEIITSRSSATSSRRTTLADLFVAESESESSSSSTVVLSNNYIAGDKKKKQLFETSSCTDQSFAAANQSGSLPDKFINHIAAAKAEGHDNRRPVKIKKLHQLMKKILKKKIYPEDNANAAQDYQKKHVQAAAAATAHHESLCLLNTGAAADAMP